MNFFHLNMGICFQKINQFIDYYQKVESSLGNIPQAQQQLDQDKILLQKLVAEFGTTAEIETQREQQQKNKEQQLTRLNQLDSAQQKLAYFFTLTDEILSLKSKLNNRA